MAKIGTAPTASRYDGIATSSKFGYNFETQAGTPVDGTNSLLRDLSPFQLRLLPPDALLEAVAQIENGVDPHSSVGTSVGGGSTRASANRVAQARAVNLIHAAAQGADRNPLARELTSMLTRASAIGTDSATLKSFVASGKFVAKQDSAHFVTLSDAYTAADIALQLQKILKAPPLTLLVNPNNMTINYTDVQSYASATRYGYKFERWGEEQPTISFSGSTGAFIAGAADAPGTLSVLSRVNGETVSPTGVQWASKRDSAAYQNLMSLLHFYKSNGYIYDTVSKSQAHLFVGAVAIDYDMWTYAGHIESFDWGYSADKPHNIDWSMEFVVDRMYDNASPTMAVTLQQPPTESPQGYRYAGGGTPRGSVGDAISRTSSTFESAIDESSEFGILPFELLIP